MIIPRLNYSGDKFLIMYNYFIMLSIMPILTKGFEFLVENGNITFVSGLEIKDLQLIISFDMTDENFEDLSTFYADGAENVTKIPALIHTSRSKELAKVKDIVVRGATLVYDIAKVGKAIGQYLNPSLASAVIKTCQHTYSLVTQKELTSILKLFKENFAKIDLAWKGAVVEPELDKPKLFQIYESFLTFETELKFILSKLSTLLSVLDTLLSNRYPTILQGVYHETACVGIMTEEEHVVKQCTKFKEGVSCDIEVWYPSLKRTMPVLLAVPYFGHIITGPNGEDNFVRDSISKFYQALTCYPNSKLTLNHKICQLTRMNSECELGLSNQDYTKILNTCTWAKNTNMPPSMRLADQGVLVMEKGLKVSIKTEEGTEVITTEPPFKVENKDTLLVEGSGLTIQYPGDSNYLSNRIINSSIPHEILRSFQSQINYLTYWSFLWMPSIIDYSMIFIQIMMIVMFLCMFKRQQGMTKKVDQIRRFRFIPRGTLIRRPRQVNPSTVL
jgi:hypothetical protein